MPNLKIIGKRLAKLRGNKTRREVSKHTDISISTIGMYEQGRRMPRDEIKVKLAKYFGVTVQSIFFD